MKKLLTIALTLTLALSMFVSAFAAGGSGRIRGSQDDTDTGVCTNVENCSLNGDCLEDGSCRGCGC